MKKVAIISELRNDDCNYGSKLQAFALNYYINKNFKNMCAESLIINNRIKRKITNPILFFLSRVKSRVCKYFSSNKKIEIDINKRLDNANSFMKKHIIVNDKITNYEILKNCSYDYIVVGSDVVWMQHRYMINRIPFLDFERNDIIKIAYAASFGKNYIPKENVNAIKNCLNKFKAISVREKNAVNLLNNIGVKNVVNVCDPTLLISKEEWKSIELNPKLTKEKYVFVYLLGDKEKQRNVISSFAKKNNLKIINIPFANEKYNEFDESFGDYKINDCSIENWLYLIHNAEYVITDSFHCTILSTIFEKKFFVLNRDYLVNINDRMKDFLEKIEQQDKYIDNSEINSVNNYNWNYKKINVLLNNYKKESLLFLQKALSEGDYNG